MAENFTTYTKVDPNNRLTVRSASLVTINKMTRIESAYLYKDMGTGYYSGNFSFDINVLSSISSVASNVGVFYPFNLANSIGDANSVANSQGVQVTTDTSNNIQFWLRENSGGAPHYSVSSYTGVIASPYFLTFRRDAAVGTYGTIYLDIYSDSSRSSLLTTLSLALSSSQAFRYIYAVSSHNDASSYSISGSVESRATTATGAALARIRSGY